MIRRTLAVALLLSWFTGLAPAAPPPAPASTDRKPTALDPTRLREMQVRFLIATEHYREGNYAAAITEWQEVLKIDPQHPLAREKIKKARERLKKG